MGKGSLALIAVLLVLGCGGSSGPGKTSTPSVIVSGVAATGAPVSGKVYAKDGADREVKVNTLADGSFSIEVGALTLPVILKAEWTGSGGVNQLYAFATRAGTVHVTPLSDLALRVAAGGADLANTYATPTNAALTALASQWPGALIQVASSLAPLLASYGVSTDPFSGAFTANHQGLDKLLDDISVTYSGGSVFIRTQGSGALIFFGSLSNLTMGVSSLAWTAADAALAQDPFIAVSPQGRGLVVWAETGVAHTNIRAKWLDGSSPPVTLSNGLGEASVPRLSFDGLGNAVAIWAQDDTTVNQVWVARYVVGQGWGAPRQISTLTAAGAGYPGVACDGLGNALAVWYQGSGVTNHFDVWASAFSVAGGTWGAPVLVSDGINNAYRSCVAMNGSGNALAVWSQDQGNGSVSNGPKDVWGRTFTLSGGWGTTHLLNAVSGATKDVYGQAVVAMDAGGNGTALWVQQSAAGPYIIWANRFASSGGWGNALEIASGATGDCYGPDVVMDGSGQAHAVWQQQTGVSAFTAANVASPGGTWSTSRQLSDDSGDCYDPHVAVDGNGQASAVWYQMEPTVHTVRMARQISGTWSAATLVDTLGFGNGFTYPVPRIGASSQGPCQMVWGVDSY